MSNNSLIKDPYQLLDDYIDSLPYKKENLILILHHAQGLFGYLPDKVQWHIAQKLDIPSAKVYGVVSFYSFFTMKPRGQHVANVCMGTACFVRGSEKLQQEIENQLGIKTGQTTEDHLFSLDSVRCIGACGLAPVITVDGKVHGRLENTEDIKEVFAKYRSEATPDAQSEISNIEPMQDVKQAT
ncbi:NADH-quinone oxidoreductase subunit NuoE family protein [Desulfosporosinus nitroreducens]|uniref:NAD(P)H-dependent oxidoreductase subunit E n=1 Tax=Desulfosporosinus nitroreducens TaxID=2018668 RepID=A0ABT8QNH5_9FIRM|nr:NAD(P)H-dependent oxidoreductase subunit E [Desulfosporosinus nitroreducens]MCO1603243.1 NAD(P)H-dependent oxidoreductase subunit E [Desulfosporosinus nitroreducens]MDO0822195.1 NAD(P)H-dependent oxidoreductase subunit E [Desulfosporosinus nitroreducens]